MTIFSYDANIRLTEKRTPLEVDASKNIIYLVETYLYDEVGNLTKKTTTDSKDKTLVRQENYTYYPNKLLETVTDNSGRYMKNHYDKNGNVIKIEKLRDKDFYDIEKFEYDVNNRLVKYIQLMDEADVFNANSLANISNLRDGEYTGKLQVITAYEYDLLGNKIKETLPRGFGYTSADTTNRDAHTVTYSYDILNRLEGITRKVNGVDVGIQFVYDEVGNKIKEINERNHETQFTYDSVNRVKTLTDAKNNTLTYQYDLAGNKVAETNSKGHTMTYGYDKLNRLEIVKDPYDVVVTKNIYDANGNVIKQIDAKGYLSATTDEARYGTIFTYDLGNRLTKMVDPEVAALNDPTKFTFLYQYNPFGERIKETDGQGNTKQYVYDNAGRLIKVIDQLGITTSYGYNHAGNKIYMMDGRGKTTKYTYGALGLLRSTTNADNKTIQYHYDLSKNLVAMEDRNGDTTLFTYDERGLVIKKEVLGSTESIGYTYDEVGNRTSMKDESGESQYTYDENNRLLEVKKDGISQIKYTYDASGNVETVTDKKGNITTYTYDKSNRMKTVDYKDKTTEYTYDENGNRKAILYHGGVKEEYIYDKNNRLINLINKAPSGNEISRYSYTYDLSGRQNSKTDSFGKTNYTYDAAGRVLKVEAPGKTTVYAYDAAGNRQSMKETYTSPQPSDFEDVATGELVKYMVKKSEYVYTDSNTLIRLVEKLYDEAGKEILEKTIAYIYDDNGNELRQNASYIMPAPHKKNKTFNHCYSPRRNSIGGY